MTATSCVMAQPNKTPSEREKEKIRIAIESGDKVTIEHMIKKDSIDVNADISLW